MLEVRIDSDFSFRGIVVDFLNLLTGNPNHPDNPDNPDNLDNPDIPV